LVHRKKSTEIPLYEEKKEENDEKGRGRIKKLVGSLGRFLAIKAPFVLMQDHGGGEHRGEGKAQEQKRSLSFEPSGGRSKVGEEEGGGKASSMNPSSRLQRKKADLSKHKRRGEEFHILFDQTGVRQGGQEGKSATRKVYPTSKKRSAT